MRCARSRSTSPSRCSTISVTACEHTRWPDRELVDDWSQGIPLAYVQNVVEYWITQYDWRTPRAGAQPLRSVRHRDRRDRHPLHPPALAASRGDPAADHPRLAGLDRRVPQGDRAAHRPGRLRRRRRRRVPRRRPLAPRLRLLGQARRDRLGCRTDRGGVGDADGPPRLRPLRRPGRRLGLGSDVGGRRDRSRALRVDPPHAGDVGRARPASRPSPRSCTPSSASSTTSDWDSGYSTQQQTRPQTLGYGLADSPAGQLAWILEKFWAWTDCDGHPENVLTRDEMLDNVMLYWVTGSATSSARIYWESFGGAPSARR